ncbi:hypothetical protein Hanom_Chr02g00098151 [Helianthus anomalus]
MRQGSGEDVCRAANTAADKVWSRQKFKNGKGLPSRENKRERVVRERGGIVGGVHSYLNQSHLFPFFKKNSLPLHQVFKPLPTFFTKV